MRILATGDWQAGVPTVALGEQEKVWHAMVDLAIEHTVDVFLHGGDLYNGPVVTMEHIAAVRRVFNRLRRERIPVLVIRGNGSHDLAMRPVDALDLFRDYEGITISTRPEVVGIGGGQVVTLPWARPGHVLAATNGALSHDQANIAMADALVKIAADLRAEALPAGPCVLLAHWAVSGAKLPTGLPVDQLREPVLSWPDLDTIGFDVIVGAHVHQPQTLTHALAGDKTIGFVVGSPQQLNHGETGEHGCWLVDVPESSGVVGVHEKFIPIESQRFVTLNLDAESGELPLEDLETLDNAIVRVRYEATEEQARRIGHSAVRAALVTVGAAKVTIEPRIQRDARARSEAITDQLGPLDALDAYCEAQFEWITNAMRERMRETLAEWMTA